MKKTVLLFLAVLLPLAMAAVEAAAAPAPITFRMFNAELNPNADGFQSAVAKEITRQTGVTLDIEYNISASEQEKISLMAASGDVPDLMSAKSSIFILQQAGLRLQ